MGLTDPISASALCAALLLLTLLMRRRRQSGTRRTPAARESLDTVQAWHPEAVRVLTIAERRAYDLLRNSLPGFLVLAQVPLSRFLRVPTRHSHAEWMHRAGSLSADLLVCDAGSRVLAVIDIRPADQTDRSRQRQGITSPADGALYALDPDMPMAVQRIGFAGERGQWVLNGRPLGQGERLNWLPRPGRHELQLRTGDGQVLDRVRFEVRGLPRVRSSG